jgi:hypothetical protein
VWSPSDGGHTCYLQITVNTTKKKREKAYQEIETLLRLEPSLSTLWQLGARVVMAIHAVYLFVNKNLV